MKALHFGAGNIGRGFIGLILSQADYQVCFVDVNDALISALNQQRSYSVVLADDLHQEIKVNGVSGINSLTHADEVIAQIAEVPMITTAVGPNVLPNVAATIAAGLQQRYLRQGGPLLIMACENMIEASSSIEKIVGTLLSEEEQEYVSAHVVFADTAVDRIVPAQQHEDLLRVVVEPFFEWVVERKVPDFPYPDIAGMTYVEDLHPYIERKLFTVNTGHATAAYHGYLKGYETIDQAMADDDVYFRVRSVLEETGRLLVHKHGFSASEHQAYIHKIIGRFRNKHITDTVVRVGRSPLRKLGPQDRFVKPAVQYNEAFNDIPRGLVATIQTALKFDYAGDEEALIMQRELDEQGLKAFITHQMGLAAHTRLYRVIEHEFSE